MKTVLYIHGKSGNASESTHYEKFFPDCKVIGLDYKTFSPWETGKEIHDAVASLKKEAESIILIANSIGAFFSMNANLNGLIIVSALFFLLLHAKVIAKVIFTGNGIISDCFAVAMQ